MLIFPIIRQPIFLFALILLQTGCASSLLHTPVPEQYVTKAVAIQSPTIRFWGDNERNQFLEQSEFVDWLQQRTQHIDANEPTPTINFLALSGGGEDGSFAAGIITGWTQHGSRPVFDVVTGVSAGALASPFIFLGTEYDEILFDVYSNLSNKDIYRSQIINGIFGGPSLFDNRPLKNLISRYVTPELLQSIADEHLKGRRLWIGTTNLDAGRPVIWDVGEIALSGQPNTLELVHNILLASSAVPGIFPPVLIDVSVGNQKFTEVHVDGGVTRQVFLYPSQFIKDEQIEAIGDDIQRKLYIIRNGRSQAIYEPVKTNAYSIALKSLNMTMENKAVGDLYRIYEITSRDDIEYNLAIIPKSFDLKPKETFDPEYTKALFDFGYKLAKDGYSWQKVPPESKR